MDSKTLALTRIYHLTAIVAIQLQFPLLAMIATAVIQLQYPILALISKFFKGFFIIIESSSHSVKIVVCYCFIEDQQKYHSYSIFIYFFIWGFTSLSTLYRSYHDG